jgi:hypothetical protein
MRILLVALAVFSATALLAQEVTRSIGIQVLPGVSSRRFLPQGLLSTTEVQAIEDREIASASFGAGIDFLIRGDKAGFNLGLLYQELGYQTNRFDWPGADFETAEEQLTQRLITLPATVNFYQELGRTDRFYFFMGLEAAYQLSIDETRTRYGRNGSQTEPIERPEDEEFRRSNVGLRTGLGWEHDFSSRLTLSMQPTFQYWFRPLLRSTDVVNRNLYNLGVRVALHFGL